MAGMIENKIDKEKNLRWWENMIEKDKIGLILNNLQDFSIMELHSAT